MIHLLQWTHATALLIKYLNGEEPIGKCHVLFASEYTRSYTVLRKQIIRPPNSRTFPFSKSHTVLLHQQLKYDRVLVFILREVIYRFHLFNTWSKFAVITQAENCFGVLAVVAWFEINQGCGNSLLNTDTHVKVTGQQMNFGCSDLQDIQVLLTLTLVFSNIGFGETQEALKLLLRWGINILELCLCKLRVIPPWTKSIPCHGFWDRAITSRCHIPELQLHC